MKNTPLVSAIITTRNRLELLKRAIDGVRNQTYVNIELIVVDDASCDGTQEYCQNEDFTYIRIAGEESRGGNHARNIGIMAAQGELVAFCDDDDCWLPAKIEKQVALMVSGGAGLVHCPRIVEVVSDDGTAGLHRQQISSLRRGDMRRRVLYMIPAVTSSILVRKNLLEQVGMFDESIKYWQEYELCIRLAQVTQFDFVDEPLYVYRVNARDPHRLTNRYKEWRQTVNQIFKKHSALYDTLTIKEKFRYMEMISSDAIERAHAAGLKPQFYFNRLRRVFLHSINKY